MRIHRVRGLIAYSYLIETEAGLYLMDGGFLGQGNRLLSKIARLKRSPEELRLAVLTHGHPDHYAGLPELQDVVEFDVLVHPLHREVVSFGAGAGVSPGGPAWARGYERIANITLSHLRLRPVHHLMDAEDGQRLDAWGLPATIVFTPGHSDGDVSIVLDSGHAFVGDAVQGRRAPWLHPELPAMLLDEATLLDSWQKLLDASAQHIWPAHGTPMSARSMKRTLSRLR